jgi:hypothetical protein
MKVLRKKETAADSSKSNNGCHFEVGQQFTFRISLLQAHGIPSDYEDVYCQFRFGKIQLIKSKEKFLALSLCICSKLSIYIQRHLYA